MEYTDLQKRDHKLYFIEEGDEGFSPQKNKAIIENSIKKYEALKAKKNSAYTEKVRERVDAVVSYLKSKKADNGYDIESYLGKKNLAYMRGQRILQRVKRLKSGGQVVTLEEIS